jgi:hypothetical protein
MAGKPTTLPAADAALGRMPAQALDATSDLFDFSALTSAASAAPDVTDPPISVRGDVLWAEIQPAATLPDHALDHWSDHVPGHVTDWFNPL